MSKLSSLQAVRREKMLDAGQDVILRSGLRAATMEAIAAQAGVAKPTLYKYFPDKLAIYDALIVRLTSALQAEFDAALAQEGTVADRIAAALTAKKKFVHRLLHSSPHASELGGDEFESQLEPIRAFERHVEEQVTQVLMSERDKDAPYMAQLLIACANGVGKQAKYVEQIGPALRLVVRKLLS